MDKCKECKKEYNKDLLPMWFVTKLKCDKCYREQKAIQDRKYRERMGEKLLEKKRQYQKSGGEKKQCKVCEKDFYGAWKSPKYCSRECFFKHEKTSRIGKGNPAYRNGTRSNGKKYNQTHFKATSKYRKDFLDKNNYLFCENCGTNQSLRFEVHHIIFASEKPRHEHLHNFRNLIMVCIKCHNDFHSGVTREMRKHLVKKRNLVELFGHTII